MDAISTDIEPPPRGGYADFTMNAAIRALMTGVIDYAGLFPPAALALEPAIRNYARYLNSEDRWMLGRFICPASKLGELSPFVDELFAGEQGATGSYSGTSPGLCRIAALGRGGKTREEFDIGMRADAEAIRTFNARHAAQHFGHALVDAFETRAPANANIPLEMSSFVEANIGVGSGNSTDNWRSAITHTIESAELRQFGFKLRTGGVEANAFPPADQIAFAIVACRDARVPIKFTAGLHHPIRHFNPSVQTRMHGFINVFAAGVLAHVHGFDGAHPGRLDEAKLIPILTDEDSKSFQFDNDGLRYKNLSATITQTESARRQILSFGSCSFDEPRDDLRSLGWL
ncbi:MAG TPA: hypothetical protein PK402_09260 [Tepidisphaeraceae bacterium]|nr:hypothetical protein [Tepidisphaeraceae bacterium]